MSINPYRDALEALLDKVTDSGIENRGQRRGIKRAIGVVDQVWEALDADHTTD